MTSKLCPNGSDPYVAGDCVMRAYRKARRASARGSEPLKDDMSLQKLQKMTYVAHGYCLAIFDAPLVGAPIEAWKHGPVIPEIHDAVTGWPRAQWENGAALPPDVLEIHAYGAFSDNDFVPPERERMVERVCEVFGGLDGGQLSARTHLRDSPWSQHKIGERMDNDVIRRHYQERLEANGIRSMGL